MVSWLHLNNITAPHTAGYQPRLHHVSYIMQPSSHFICNQLCWWSSWTAPPSIPSLDFKSSQQHQFLKYLHSHINPQSALQTQIFRPVLHHRLTTTTDISTHPYQTWRRQEQLIAEPLASKNYGLPVTSIPISLGSSSKSYGTWNQNQTADQYQQYTPPEPYWAPNWAPIPATTKITVP